MKTNKGFSSIIIAAIIAALAVVGTVTTIVLIVSNSDNSEEAASNNSSSETDSNSASSNSSNSSSSSNNTSSNNSSSSSNIPANLSEKNKKRWEDLERITSAMVKFHDKFGTFPASWYRNSPMNDYGLKPGDKYYNVSMIEIFVNEYLLGRNTGDYIWTKEYSFHDYNAQQPCVSDLFCDPDGYSYQFSSEYKPDESGYLDEKTYQIYLSYGHKCGDGRKTYIGTGNEDDDVAVSYVLDDGEIYCKDLNVEPAEFIKD